MLSNYVGSIRFDTGVNLMYDTNVKQGKIIERTTPSEIRHHPPTPIHAVQRNPI